MVVIVFRTRIRADADQAEMAQLGSHMYELSSAMPGFVSYKDFVAEDGESVSIVEFESLETLHAWRMHPEHQHAQRRGREAMFGSYRIQVCETVREYDFAASH
jgi:heme-degrading monooxygenase HmoA